MGAIATKEGIDSVRKLLGDNQDKIAIALGKAIDPEYFVSVAITCVVRTPKLLECTRASLFGALLASAQLRLVPDGVLGQAYLVPYKDKVVFIPGYKGLRELVLRTGKYIDLRARVVYENDEFEYTYGVKETIFHNPAKKDKGEMIAVYAVAEQEKGANIEVLYKEDIEEHRNQYSKAWKKEDSAWQTATARMWEKTAIRRLAGRLQMSVEAQTAFGYEERMNAGLDLETGEVLDIDPVVSEENALDALTEDLEKRNEEEAGGENDLPIESTYQTEKEFIIKYLNKCSPNSAKKQLEKLKYFCDGADPDFNAEKITGIQDLSDEMVLKVFEVMHNN